MMTKRITIWEETDYFEIGGKRIDMDAADVTLPEGKVSLVWMYQFEGEPFGHVDDIRLEDGAIVGTASFFDATHYDVLESIDHRYGGYYNDIKYFDKLQNFVKSSELKAVSVILPVLPGIPMDLLK